MAPKTLKNLTLQQQIEAGRQTIRAEAYAMSIGELVSSYTRSELVIRPEFQRLFRWNVDQKSRLIESLLLGIPLPSIFVMQREDGVWEVIDGLQRLSTILEFMGELRDEDSKEVLAPSVLSKTEYLPGLDGVTFGADDKDDEKSLSAGQRLSLKRAKIDVKILLPESDDKAKFELFDRLNAGGSQAVPQEIRTAQLIMRDRSMYDWLESLRSDANFQRVIPISDRLYEEAYDMELVCRYLALTNSTPAEWRSFASMDKFISDKLFGLTEDSAFDRDAAGRGFHEVFTWLADSIGDESFRRYDSDKVKFTGAFSVSAFESVTTGLRNNDVFWRSQISRDPSELTRRVEELWDNVDFRRGSGSGIGASTRIPRTLPAAIKHFSA
jgi:hypothetical protein